MPQRHDSLFRPSSIRWTIWSYFVGFVFVLLAWLPEYFPGSAPGFGPMQICMLLCSVVAVVVGTVLLLRMKPDLRRQQLSVAFARTWRLAARSCLCIGSISMTLAIAEGWARWRAKPSDAEARWLELIRDLPEGEQLAKDRNRRTTVFRGLQYSDYYIYGVPPTKLPTITFTSFFADRPCPNSVSEDTARERVWFFGGSTMMELETTDERTIANNAIKQMNASGVSAVGHNFGMGMFQSCLELVKFQDILRRVTERQRPTTVVFYDGFNDAYYGYYFGAGRMQSDVTSRLRMVVERDYCDMVRIGLIEGLFRNSQLYQDYGRRLSIQQSAIAGLHQDPSEKNLSEAVSIYWSNVAMARSICERFQIVPVFVLQPLVVTKRGRTEKERQLYESCVKDGLADFVERFYKSTRAAMADCDTFVDLSGILDDNGRTDFTDLGHTGPYTGADIGEALGRRLVVLTRRRASAADEQSLNDAEHSYQAN